MGRHRRFGRPDKADVLAATLFNAAMGCLLLPLCFVLFGVRNPFPDPRHAALTAALAGSELRLIGALALTAACGFVLLWYWLVITGRRMGVEWGAALLYGIAIACADVPFVCMLWGLVHGAPLIGALLGVLLLWLVPGLAGAMVVFGLGMGCVNGILALRWIERYYPKR